MKKSDFKSHEEKTTPEFDEVVFHAVLPELQKNEARYSQTESRRWSLSWIFSGLAVASIAGVISFRFWFQTQSEQDPVSFAGFDVLDVGSDIDLADLEDDFDLFLDDEFEKLMAEEHENQKES